MTSVTNEITTLTIPSASRDDLGSVNVTADNASEKNGEGESSLKTSDKCRRVIFPSLHKTNQNLKGNPKEIKLPSEPQVSPRAVTSKMIHSNCVVPILPILLKNKPSTEKKALKKVKFDPNIWVHEFQREKSEFDTTWFSGTELWEFQQRAKELIEEYSNRTGRMHTKALYTHPALCTDNEDEHESTMEEVVQSEIRRILIVDPHLLCAALFCRLFRRIFPRAELWTASSSEEAMRLIDKCGGKRPFDIILVEEHLGEGRRKTSGSEFIEVLNKTIYDEVNHTLFIAVSSHFQQDKDKLLRVASIAWPKPPPKFDDNLRNTILESLLKLRGKQQCPIKNQIVGTTYNKMYSNIKRTIANSAQSASRILLQM